MVYETKKIKLSSKNIYIYAFSIMGIGKIENQDSFLIHEDDNQVIIAVADGLGSAHYSKEGSMKIVEVSANILSNTEKYNDIYFEILSNWKNSLEGNLNQYDTTLKFIKITKNNLVYGGVGDGWISIKSDQGVLNVISENTFSNQTDSILTFNLKDKFTINNIQTNGNIVGLISTDGFSEDIAKENCDIFLSAINSELIKDENGFVDDMKITLSNWPIETNRDDKTVVFFRIEEGEQ